MLKQKFQDDLLSLIQCEFILKNKAILSEIGELKWLWFIFLYYSKLTAALVVQDFFQNLKFVLCYIY